MLWRLASYLLFALVSVNAHAESFQVTRLNDPWPNGCLPGDCSLREAMEAAAANDPLGATDVIVVPAGNVVLTLGELVNVDQRLRVQGAGSGQTRIVLDEEFTQLFQTAAGGDLALIGLTLDAAGTALSACHDGLQGGPLVIDDVVFEDGSLTVCGTTQIRRSEVRTSLFCNSGQTLVEDGAISDLIVQGSVSTMATLRRVLIDGALDPDNAGATRVNMIRGSLVIEDSTITRSEISINGVGPSALTLRRVRYIANVGPIRTETDADVTIEDSLFENNMVRALYAAGDAEWNVSGSSFVNNRTDGNAGGAVVLEDDTTLRIRNSTFSGNSFTVAAAANGARGAAIGYRNGDGAQLILTHVTLVRPNFFPAGIIGTGIGGLGNGVALTLSNSIVQASCGIDAGVLQNNTGNIESIGNTCGLDPLQNRVNESSASLALGPLDNNGGRTPTHIPAVGSVAIDRASTPQCVPTDQRGYHRPGGLRCDAGAVEADADDDLFANGFES